MGADEVVKGMPGDGEHGLAIALGVVEAVEQVNTARSGSRHADAQPAGVLGVAAGREGRRLLVPHLDVLELVLVLAPGLEDAVDAIAGQAENRVHASFQQALHQ
jgi:hypothetical protein